MSRIKRLLTGGVVFMSLLLCGSARGETAITPLPIDSPDVLIDVGHGGVDSGTSYGSILEKDINLTVALKLYKILQKQHVTVSVNRTDDYALSDDNKGAGSRHRRDLAQRVQIANQLKPKTIVSIHVNWSSAIKRSGPIVLYQNNSRSLLLASSLQQSLNRLYKSSNRPEFGKTFYLLNHSQNPTVIVEMGFLSNDGDRKRLTSDSGQKKLAEAIASAIRHYLVMEPETPKRHPAAK